MFLLKKHKRISLLSTFLLIIFAGVANAQIKTVTVNINLSKTYQTIDNFSASDAWACQFVGNWPNEKKNKIADLLFSNETLADGSPKGIALSLWRFNIGAGSTQQGDSSSIKDEWRRAESLLNADGSYNPQNQAGQIWFMQAAKARGVKQFLGFSNSPPVQLTVTRKAFASKGQTNIAPDQYNNFAGFLSTVVKGVEQYTGIKFNYISPVNEPQWDWSDGGQEGCPYNNTEIAGLVKVINTSFVSKGIPSKILVSEAGSINYLYAGAGKTAKGNQIQEFFKAGSANYIGNLQNVAKTIAGHSYFTTSPMTTAVKMRKALADSVALVKGLNFWQSEYCILGDNAGEIDGNKRDLGINAALYLARVIHTDLTTANAAAWQWWTAISAYDYKDGLIYIDKNKTDGNYYPAKMLWALGNYSRFVRPGAIRVDATTADSVLNKPLLISSFKKGKDFTTVIINQNTIPVYVNLKVSNGSINLKQAYLTSNTDELKAEKLSPANKALLIPARSVKTVTGIIK